MFTTEVTKQVDLWKDSYVKLVYSVKKYVRQGEIFWMCYNQNFKNSLETVLWFYKRKKLQNLLCKSYSLRNTPKVLLPTHKSQKLCTVLNKTYPRHFLKVT